MFSEIKNQEIVIAQDSRAFEGILFIECTILAQDINDLPVTFKNCQFDDCKFVDCVMINAFFDKCVFGIMSHFEECSMENMVMSDCSLSCRMGFVNCALSDMQIEDCEIFEPLSFRDCNLANAKIDLAKMYKFQDDKISSAEKSLMIWGCWVHNDLLVNVGGLDMIARIEFED